jgi:hypothetical protein
MDVAVPVHRGFWGIQALSGYVFDSVLVDVVNQINGISRKDVERFDFPI